jgi:hypothetical protein|tara:strand:- start:80 stop:472 length:393 start_codon:yes stop_codon:yes gene_type:complete
MSEKLDKMTKVFIKIRDKRAELSAKFKSEDEVLLAQQDTIKQYLLEYCKAESVDSVKTAEGTFYRSKRTKYWASDWPSMYKFIAENEVPEFFEKRINQTVVATWLEENPELVPEGLNVDSKYVLTVKKGK